MEDVDYVDLFIAVAEDCPVTAAEVPQARNGKATVASLQYELLADHPYELTSADVIFESWRRRQARPEAELPPDAPEVLALRAEFYAKPQACLRSSPLAKRHGWGFRFDGEGRIELVAMESDEYRRLAAGNEVEVRKALRSKRA